VSGFPNDFSGGEAALVWERWTGRDDLLGSEAACGDPGGDSIKMYAFSFVYIEVNVVML